MRDMRSAILKGAGAAVGMAALLMAGPGLAQQTGAAQTGTQQMQDQAQAGQGDPQTIISGLHDDYEAAFNKGDAAGVADLYADDALVMAPNQDPAEDRAAVEKLMRTGLEERGMTDLRIEPVETRMMGSTILDIGTYSASAKGPEGQAMPLNGDYLTVAEQDDQGDWKISRHIWNVDVPEDAPVASR